MSVHHAVGFGFREQVNHSMAQILSLVLNERQDHWDEDLLHVESAHSNAVISVTGLSPR